MVYQSPYGKIHYDDYGPKDAKTLVFVHGLGADSKCFIKQVVRFKKTYRVIVFDLPNHGQSFHFEGRFDYHAVGACLIGLLDELEIRRAVLIGLSLGGHITQHIAFHHPKRIEALVDIGSTPLHIPLRRLTYYRLYAILLISYFLPVNILIKMIAGKDRGKTEISKNFIMKRLAEQTGKREVLDTARVMVKLARKGIPAQADKPLLIVHGENDNKTVKKVGKRWHENTEKSVYAVIENAGHVACLDNARGFNKELAKFLETLPTPDEIR